MITVVIQAGGDSRRMGQDKGLLPFLGQPLVQRVLERVQSLADEILVTTNRPDGYRFLNTPLVPDRLPGRGALGGLYTAFVAASHPIVIVVACDMPFVSGRLLRAQVQMIDPDQADIVIPRLESGFEPFHAVYRRASCLGPAEAALQAERWRADSWFDQVRVRAVDLAEMQKYDPRGLALKNVNTPDELVQAEALAQLEAGISGL